MSAPSAAFVLQIFTKQPAAPTIAVLPSDVSGPPGSNITNINHVFVGEVIKIPPATAPTTPTTKKR